MRLIEALKVVNRAGSRDVPTLHVALNCGFTPLHFETFLAARMALHNSEKSIRITHGLYGDVIGNFERLISTQPDLLVVAIEWADLDARLGLRSSGGWEPQHLPDILRSVHLQLEHIISELKGITSVPVVISLPTLPLPPVAYTKPSRFSSFEAELRYELATFAHAIIASENIRLIAPDAIQRVSLSARFDITSELLTGFPYTLEHADSLAELITSAVFHTMRKKGLITDLDDTLWRGLLGEVGASAVGWSLDEKAQIHGLYQRFLASLAASGTLLAIASKNNPELVDEVLNRNDLLIPRSSIFPIEVHWNSKSESIERILHAWNIGPDSVVFVDDSPMELAEVQAAFPDVECLLFPKDDPAGLWDLLFLLRERFGTDRITIEDSLRTQSLRARAQFEVHRAQAASNADDFLSRAEAELTLVTGRNSDKRALELLNKTNQFNLNGVRLTEAEWNAILADPRRFIVRASYTDRYGPLGTIAAIIGTAGQPDSVTIDQWVMSCRAFARRIEHACLKWIFEHFNQQNIVLHFVPTARNQPTREFLARFLDRMPDAAVRLSRVAFEERCPPLYQTVKEISQ